MKQPASKRMASRESSIGQRQHQKLEKDLINQQTFYSASSNYPVCMRFDLVGVKRRYLCQLHRRL